jgi:hypothetical protein
VAAGYKKMGTSWFTDEELAVFPQSIDIGRVEGQSEIAKTLRLTTEIWRSGRFHAEGSGAPTEFENYLRSTRNTDAFITFLTKRPTGPPETPHYFYTLDDSDTFGEYLDAQPNLSPTDRAFYRDIGAHAGFQSAVVGTPLSSSHADFIAHHLGQRGLGMVGGRTPAWLLAGFTDYVSDRLNGTMICRFVKQESSGGSSGGVNQMTGMMWRRRLQAAVLTGSDAPFEDVFRADIPGLLGIPSMKAWSVFHFLARRNQAGFADFIRITQGAEDGSHTAAALKEVFGLTLGQLELQWREWAVEHF